MFKIICLIKTYCFIFVLSVTTSAIAPFIRFANSSAMKSNSTQYVPRGGYDQKRRMQPGRETPVGPIINWTALWTRLWLFLKRIVAELWYLLSRRQPRTVSHSRSDQPSKMLLFFRSWSWPLLKVTTVAVLFFYVMQRDIQFSIQMKAPLGQAVAYDETNGSADQMGFVQSVSFSSAKHTERNHPAQLDATSVESYLERFGHIAQAEMSKFGVPASIKMAQAIIESQAGQAMATKVDNNHFGAPMEGQPYESAWRNWREHSLLLVNRYSALTKYGNDVRAWARGLEDIGYSKAPNYANQLLEIIDRFHLEQLDEPTI